MKAFIDEYGFAVVKAVVIALLLIMVVPIGNFVFDNIKEWTDSKNENAVEQIQNNSNSDVILRLSRDSSGITINAISKKAGVYILEYSIKHNGIWSNWNSIGMVNKEEEKEFFVSQDDIEGWSLSSQDFIKFKISGDIKSYESEIFTIVY